MPPCQEGDKSGIPRLPRTTKPFSIFPQGGRRTPVRNVSWFPSLHRQRSRHLSPLPAISAQPAWCCFGSEAGLCSGQMQVAVKLSPEVDPTLGRGGLLASPRNLPDSQTLLLGEHNLITLFAKTRVPEDFLKNFSGAHLRETCLSASRVCSPGLLALSADFRKIISRL
jgi:hypothetical protein